MRGKTAAGYKLLPALIACIADIYTKSKIRGKAYEKHPVTCLGGKITITRWFNYGAMFGIFKYRLNFLRCIMSAGLSGLVYMLFFGDYGIVTNLGLSLAIGGAAGNTYERIRYGKVTDFIRFNAGPKRFQEIIFNIGDFAVFSGIFLMCSGELIKKRKIG